MKTINYPQEEIVNAALRAMLYEVVLTPKPGLVDPVSPGAHDDMDVFTFIDSTLSLRTYFEQVFEAGYLFYERDLRKLFSIIRPMGISAERTMLLKTNGVNTHKGIIFSLGILVASLGYIFSLDKDIFDDYDKLIDQIPHVVIDMLCGLTKSDFSKKNNLPTSSGEDQFLKYNIGGAREEAESGFPTVFKKSLPFLRNQSGSMKEKLLDTLMFIAANINDSNLIKRAGTILIVSEMKKIQLEYFQSKNKSMFLTKIDQDFTRRNLTIGGSADLLILTIFLNFLQQIKKEQI